MQEIVRIAQPAGVRLLDKQASSPNQIFLSIE